MTSESSIAVTGRSLKILLIAYEFPPSPSPQSLRWAYLVRELAIHGHQVHVLAPEHPGNGTGLPELPESVVIHRTFAGPSMGLLNFLARGRRRQNESAPPTSSVKEQGVVAATQEECIPGEELNWKGRLHHALNRQKMRFFHGLQRLMSGWFFPDARAEWFPWARRRLRHLLATLNPDLVISSHEPATTLTLGLVARRSGFPWVTDLGDPVLAPYTPERWHSKALRLESEVCACADLVMTTTEAAARILRERHLIPEERLRVLTQGFDGRAPATGEEGSGHDGAVLELLYTGSFYHFRSSSTLLQAVMDTPDVRLSIASIKVPDEIAAASGRSQAIRLLGFLPHTEAVRLQRNFHVLINIANDDPCQVPGKFYEYLGSGRPILHIGSEQDAAAELLLRTGRGWVCPNETNALRKLLTSLRDAARSGSLTEAMDLSATAVREYDWRQIGVEFNRAAIAVATMNR